MKPQSGKLLSLILIGILSSACSAVGTTAATGEGATASPAASAAAATVAPSTFTPTSPAPTLTPDPNARSVKSDAISFVIPSLLGSGATVQVLPAVSKNKSSPWLIAPQYIRITLSGYPTPKESYVKPELFVYPAQDYAAVNSGANASLQRLQAVLSGSSAPMTNQVMPWLPFTPGEQSIAAQTKIIAFQNGSGVRMITQYDVFLDPVVTAPGDPITNRLLFYHFEGLSTEGKTYVIATLPLEIDFLASDAKPDAPVPAEGVPYPGLGTDIAHFDYFAAVTDHLNAASAESFTPSLNALDALISSIEVAPQ